MVPRVFLLLGYFISGYFSSAFFLSLKVRFALFSPLQVKFPVDLRRQDVAKQVDRVFLDPEYPLKHLVMGILYYFHVFKFNEFSRAGQGVFGGDRFIYAQARTV